jgi:hypothetical protein
VVVVFALDMVVRLGLGIVSVVDLGVLVHVAVGVLILTLVVIDLLVHSELAVELFNVAEVSRSAVRVEPPRPERDLVVRV